ncbi:hypothetical protein CPAR01_03995, partial [Colletotrichum paranaense]
QTVRAYGKVVTTSCPPRLVIQGIPHHFSPTSPVSQPVTIVSHRHGGFPRYWRLQRAHDQSRSTTPTSSARHDRPASGLHQSASSPTQMLHCTKGPHSTYQSIFSPELRISIAARLCPRSENSATAAIGGGNATATTERGPRVHQPTRRPRQRKPSTS